MQCLGDWTLRRAAVLAAVMRSVLLGGKPLLHGLALPLHSAEPLHRSVLFAVVEQLRMHKQVEHLSTEWKKWRAFASTGDFETAAACMARVRSLQYE